ncbi:MAG: hypothetical protein IKV81_07300 [Clostridia bacterium]|nr:hypothetical protein [Clostridia bacterium]
MLYNLRSDIIYYKTNSDFELEFNLCGCCRMRLLTDKPSSKKAFVHSLARAVSRSRVILIAGALFGEESTIKTVAQALGTETEIANNAEFNITTDDEIEIIKGSVPLVSADGLFGGCIIESGPQTMILLTDNKTLRKTLMTTLIHPYIAELYAAESTQRGDYKTAIEEHTDDEPIKNEVITEEAEVDIDEPTSDLDEAEIEVDGLVLDDETKESENQNEALEPSSIILEADDEEDLNEDTLDSSIDTNELIIEEAADEIIEEAEQEIDADTIIMDTDENEKHAFPEEYTTTFNQFVFDSETDKKGQKAEQRNIPQNDFLYLDDNGDMFNDSEEEATPKSSRLNIATLIVTAILLLAIIAICYCIFAVAGSDGVSPAEYIQTVWQTVFK